GACSLINKIIFAPACFRISRSARNRTGKVDQDYSDNSANVCTSKATAPDSRARSAQMNPSRPARFRAGLHSAQGQSANEKQPGNVLAVMARNGTGLARLLHTAVTRREQTRGMLKLRMPL